MQPLPYLGPDLRHDLCAYTQCPVLPSDPSIEFPASIPLPASGTIAVFIAPLTGVHVSLSLARFGLVSSSRFPLFAVDGKQVAGFRPIYRGRSWEWRVQTLGRIWRWSSEVWVDSDEPVNHHQSQIEERLID